MRIYVQVSFLNSESLFFVLSIKVRLTGSIEISNFLLNINFSSFCCWRLRFHWCFMIPGWFLYLSFRSCGSCCLLCFLLFFCLCFLLGSRGLLFDLFLGLSLKYVKDRVEVLMRHWIEWPYLSQLWNWVKVVQLSNLSWLSDYILHICLVL